MDVNVQLSGTEIVHSSDKEDSPLKGKPLSMIWQIGTKSGPKLKFGIEITPSISLN